MNAGERLVTVLVTVAVPELAVVFVLDDDAVVVGCPRGDLGAAGWCERHA